jgi:ribosome-associated protein
VSDQARSRIRPPKPHNARELALLCTAAALDKKGEDPVLLEVSQLTGYADYFLLVSGRSTRQASSVGENIARVLKKAGRPALGIEGIKEGRWILLDFGEVVVHVFHEPVREFYDLDSLWGDAPRVELDQAELDAMLPRPGKPAVD